MRELLEFLFERYERRYQERVKRNTVTFNRLDRSLLWMVIKVSVLIPFFCTVPLSILAWKLFRLMPVEIGTLPRVGLYVALASVFFILSIIGMVKSIVKFDAATAN